MSLARPTTHEVYFHAGPPRDAMLQNELEANYFARLRLPNSVFRTTHAGRFDDLNALVEPLLPRVEPLQLMDVAISSGISTLEWVRQLDQAGRVCAMTASDLLLHAWLVEIAPRTRVLVDEGLFPICFEYGDRSLHSGLRGSWRYPHSLPAVLALRTYWALYRRCRERRLRSAGIGNTTVADSDRNAKLARHVRLLTPQLDRYDGPSTINVVEDDLLAPRNPSPRQALHAVRAANILQEPYFNVPQLRSIVRHLKAKLLPGGLLIVCRSDASRCNHASVFERTEQGVFCETATLGDGSEIRTLILDTDCE